jgi:putative flippase GtrA
MTDKKDLSPGEARTRQRQRRQIGYALVAAIAGGLIGFFTGFFDQGNGSLFSGDWDQLKLSPAAAIGLSIALIAAFLALPLWGFTQIDDYKREQNLIGFTGGCLAVIAGFPVWVALHAGGFLPAPSAFGVFLLAFAGMIVTFVGVKIRG